MDYQDALDNAEAGRAFLEKNSEAPGVVETKSGLQYQVLKRGEGKQPGPRDKVVVHYEGKLLNGKVFDSSYQRGQTISFGVNQVIQGWQEALQLMTVGSTWMLYIPSDLAYGPYGSPGAIGPNETLIFKVELVDIA
jgi:FKBP-type peptidyl-prolyl cis-trans isomerase FklB